MTKQISMSRPTLYNRGMSSAPASRTVHINSPQTTQFVNNYVRTAKYSLLSFLPKFLWEQLRRYQNLFFILISALQQIPGVSPTGRFTTAVPFAIILSISGIKEIVEDVKRHKADKKVNGTKIQVLRDGHWQEMTWAQLQVGDLVMVKNGNFLAADIVLLSSSEPQGLCYIETANLDGETNLKMRQAVPATVEVDNTSKLHEFRGHIEAEPPSKHLYEFTANIKAGDDKSTPIGPDQLLLRGSQLRNTKWIFGCVVYSGRDTKLVQNSCQPPLKRSNVDRITNTQILFLLSVLALLALLCTVAQAIWNSNNQAHWYLQLSSGSNFVFDLMTFVILFNNLIPISLQVSLEVVRVGQAMFINWDLEMYDEVSDTPAMARTSNLNEELGQVKYIFSDKTGTLTQNIMVFKRCTIAGQIYGSMSSKEFYDQTLSNLLVTGSSVEATEFLTLMSVCHTVVPELEPNGELQYQAASPDERALVLGAKQVNFRFCARTPLTVTVEVNGHQRTWELLQVQDFTSTRKRMSVVVRTPEGKLKLYCKGADTMIYERLKKGSEQKYADITEQHLEVFAKEGLRTLCLAYADLDEEWYNGWKEKHYEASTALNDREKKLEDVAELLEKELILLGATAIEDKLQDGVPEALQTLRAADISVWMLTGDKQETAINIGHSCKLFDESMDVVVISDSQLDEVKQCLKKERQDLDQKMSAGIEIGLVIDGKTLRYALSPTCKADFLALSIACKSVICCRVSPLQKAEIVEMVKHSVNGAITLAIGDGANDVSMIQAAHVGIGISGQEGLQACLASDYAIAQFRFLVRLLLVHGAWSYHRLVKMIMFFFYKNICLYLIELWYAISNGFSGQILFDRWLIGFYNLFFTAAPPLSIGLFDRVGKAETRLKYPIMYRSSQINKLFNVKIFWMWIVNAVYHSTLVYLLPRFAMAHDATFSNGQVGGYLLVGNVVYSCVIIMVCTKAGMCTSAWSIFSFIAIYGSITAWFLFLFLYARLYPLLGYIFGEDIYGMDLKTYGNLNFWMCVLIVPITCLLRDYVWKSLKYSYFRSLEEEVYLAEATHANPADVLIEATRKSLSETARLVRRVRDTVSGGRRQAEPRSTLGRGYAFSTEEHGIMPQADMIRQYNAPQRSENAPVETIECATEEGSKDNVPLTQRKGQRSRPTNRRGR